MDKSAKELRIVYMGTPDFAVAPLRALVEGGYNVVAVVTMPDKPAGRGQKMQRSAVGEYATEQGLLLLQPEKLKSEEFVEQFTSLDVDLGIVVAFRMLPEVIWNAPKLGTFNLHASLLPQYRGAAPINWAIINGDRKSGVTTFFLNHRIDEGAIIEQAEVEITDDETAGTLHDKLMWRGTELVISSVEKIAAGGFEPLPQSADCELRPAPKIF
ncbi:MAG: methionyl-tRNA formyltransferase, partial [Tidjanibacter sp.]|nr:methionyl-tRNA formyltransferase [Tidjanibacter sp.]